MIKHEFVCAVCGQHGENTTVVVQKDRILDNAFFALEDIEMLMHTTLRDEEYRDEIVSISSALWLLRDFILKEKEDAK